MFWITHFVPDSLPTRGMKKLLFYTKQEDPKEFFCGTDNKNPRPPEEIKKLVERREIVPIPRNLTLKETETLFIDPTGTMWLAHYMDSSKNKKEVGFYDVPIQQFFQELEGSV
ncbi:MAG: hypothetical protein ABIO57_01210 [Candidatus Paceibacterota bacterium]